MQASSPLVAVMLIGWIPAVLTLFALIPSRRAVIIAFLVAWLFLPVSGYEIRFFPEYNKMSATCIGIFCSTLIFDTTRIFRFRPTWMDIPAAVLVFCPAASSLNNGLGLYDGLSESFKILVGWGLPYFLGRIYFNTPASLRELVIGVFIGGLIYIPLCWYEIRFSPQLHRLVYGFHQTSFVQVLRLGGYRPTVFLAHGLMVGMWMTAASLAGFWLWQTGSLRSIWGVPMIAYVGALLVTSLLCKSTGAIALLLVGIASLLAIKHLKTSLPMLLMAAMSVSYIAVRSAGLWDGHQLVNLANEALGADRAQSLETRIVNENALAEKARQRLLFGWGGWKRSRIMNERGGDTSITDSLWIIKIGVNGITGLSALIAVLLLPAVLLRFKIPVPLWTHPVTSCAAVTAVILCIWMLDNTMNAMANPIFVVLAGGISGLKRVVSPTIPWTLLKEQARQERKARKSPREQVVERRRAARRPFRE